MDEWYDPLSIYVFDSLQEGYNPIRKILKQDFLRSSSIIKEVIQITEMNSNYGFLYLPNLKFLLKKNHNLRKKNILQENEVIENQEV